MHVLRCLLFLLFVKPIALFLIGINLRGGQHLPDSGPAIIVANHNSHLDTMILMSLFPMHLLSQIRPVASANYFCSNPCLSWFARHIVGIIPIQLGTGLPQEVVLAPVERALHYKAIVLVFPEGTRGDPEKMSDFKQGLETLVNLVPEAPVIPIFIQGLGKALPRGEGLLVPFNCNVLIDAPLCFASQVKNLSQWLNQRLHQMARRGCFPEWE